MEDPTSRFVVVFDTDDINIRDDVAPTMLKTLGYTPEHYYPRLGVAIVTGAADSDFKVLTTHASENDLPVHVLPETTYYAITDSFTDTDEATWGLQAVKAIDSPYTGKGIKVAVLDTGFNADHPDFRGRKVTSASFVPGEGPEDGHGHGTHCVGTAMGPRARGENSRGYGVAPEAEIYVGKVLGADGSGSDSTILAGIDWALENGCQVISMSLGADVRTVHPPYVTAGKRALEQGAVIIAAAGNNAHRSIGDPGFVGAPANSPYVMAVGAVDSDMKIADFSAQAINAEGGEVDIAGPGVDVHSSWISPENYKTISGTSMATPHVSGIAALTAEATGARGQELWDKIVAGATSIGLPKQDAGAGLVTAPAAKQASTQSWVITVADDRTDDLASIADELRAAGVTVTRTLPNLGMIHGCTSTECTPDELVKVAGVTSASVEVSHRAL
ncbi:hypothetical protein HMPREF1531_01499 [Propionibacterium sp. oral taxon 192 str. F0372]|uniref:S8 family serine peptidase n=1 Tax=Propionibacterium sp. oral taxon 192 TaxID=671222 RepID=UPI00035327D7|nr:S8 family serine peptidase [Propionibacterium sp. oral taxon 192]EPH03438.1 hypothetical protein HMPREF1531_01499 [Propionibacterium sp. oral taxon 192 str. F0372]